MRIHDGAYGTLLERHIHGDETVDDLCVRDPRRVVDAHRAYLEAGADAVQTNSFLTHLRASDRRRRLLRRAAIDCAREAVAATGRDAVVFHTIGPVGDRPRDYWEAIEQALEEGCTGVLGETITSRAIADAFLAAWRDVAAGVTGVEVLLGCSTTPTDRDASAWVLDVAASAPDDVVVGLNCCAGPCGMRGLLESIVERRGTTWAMPSAGLPTSGDGPTTWPLADPDRWLEAVREQVDGVPLAALGGCCGTTPDHVAMISGDAPSSTATRS